MDSEISDDRDILDSSDRSDIFVADRIILKKNQIVWAKYRSLYWPALVRQVDHKMKKVSISFCDSLKTCFKLPFKKIHDFMDAEFGKVACEAAGSTAYADKHSNYVIRANLFLTRSFDYDDDPVEFFDLTKPYDTKTSNGKSSGSSSSEKDVAEINKFENGSNIQLEESSKNTVEEDLENENVAKKAYRGCSSKSLVFVEEKCLYDNFADEIASYIKSGFVDQHLVDVTNSKIKSQRHDLYMDAKKNNMMREIWVSCPADIPLNNRKILNDLGVHLRALYVRKFGEENNQLNEYIIYVWLPEAICKAITFIETDASKLPVGSGTTKIWNSLNNVVKNDKLIPESQVEESRLPVTQMWSLSTKATNDANLHEVEACGSSRKKQKGHKRLSSGRKDAKSKVSNTLLPST